MGDSQTNKIEISSSIVGSYKLEFIEDLITSFQKKIESDKYIFIIDDCLLDIYQKEFSIIKSHSRFISIQINEENKTIDYSKNIIGKLLSLNVKKGDILVAIGGGITQDLVAFVSSILFRGMQWEFYPSTLLAQCDSCIGSKSSINYETYKNLIGTFLPPSNIYIYNGFLDSLLEKEIKSGIGEMCHYFLINDDYLMYDLFDKYDTIFNERKSLIPFIKNSLTIKKRMIEIDEYDKNERHIFNYGHTFGHAIEAITSYSIPHGQAVTVGINIANYISFKKNFLELKEFEKIYNALKANLPSFKLNETNIDNYLKALSKDKKNKKNLLGCILKNKDGILEKYYLEFDVTLKNWLLDYSKTY